MWRFAHFSFAFHPIKYRFHLVDFDLLAGHDMHNCRIATLRIHHTDLAAAEHLIQRRLETVFQPLSG